MVVAFQCLSARPNLPAFGRWPYWPCVRTATHGQVLAALLSVTFVCRTAKKNHSLFARPPATLQEIWPYEPGRPRKDSKMDAHEAHERIVELVNELDPRAVRAEIDLIVAGGQQAWRAKLAPARSAEHAAPGFDRIDRWARDQQRQYEIHLEAALDELQKAANAQRRLSYGLGNVEPLHDEHGKPTDAAKRIAEGDDSATCANCHVVINRSKGEKVLAGRCRPCSDYRKRTGRERPADLWDTAKDAA